METRYLGSRRVMEEVLGDRGDVCGGFEGNELGLALLSHRPSCLRLSPGGLFGGPGSLVRSKSAYEEKKYELKEVYKVL